MCCFSRPVKHVSQTNIFARSTEGGRQILVYSMNIGLDEDLAMILPLPVPPGPEEDAVRFLDLSGYAHFFGDVARAFPEVFEVARKGGGLLAARGPARPRLRVHAVGLFEASFVPTVNDFDRLDPRFRLPPGTWEKLPAYRDFGFAVFKLRRSGGLLGWLRRKRTIHPMAMDFPRRDPSSIFFPTVHVHDGEVHPEAHFDHTLYCQPDPGTEALLEWERSAEPVGRFADADRAGGALDGGARCFRKIVVGTSRNRDIVLDLEELRAKVTQGDHFLLRMRDVVATTGVSYGPRNEWHTLTASELDRIKLALSERLSALTRERREAWQLTAYSIDIPEQWPAFQEGFSSLVVAPPEGQPCRVMFTLQNRRVEPQHVYLAFEKLPEREVRQAIGEELQRALDEITAV